MTSSNRGNGFFYRVLCILSALLICGGAGAVVAKEYFSTGQVPRLEWGVMWSSGIFALALGIIQSALTLREWTTRGAWERALAEQEAQGAE